MGNVSDANLAKIAWKVDEKLTAGTPKHGGERWWPPVQLDDFCLPAEKVSGCNGQQKEFLGLGKFDLFETSRHGSKRGHWGHNWRHKLRTVWGIWNCSIPLCIQIIFEPFLYPPDSTLWRGQFAGKCCLSLVLQDVWCFLWNLLDRSLWPRTCPERWIHDVHRDVGASLGMGIENLLFGPICQNVSGFHTASRLLRGFLFRASNGTNCQDSVGSMNQPLQNPWDLSNLTNLKPASPKQVSKKSCGTSSTVTLKTMLWT